MLSHEYKCIFIHIRKNAGGSIIRSFPIPGPDAVDYGYGTDGTYDKNWQTYRYPGYLVFAVARNPWSRFISGWRWLCQRTYSTKGNLGAEYYRAANLKDVIRTLHAELPEDSHDRRHLFWTQLGMLTDPDGRVVADMILRFESLERDYRLLCERLRKPYSPLPHKNKSRGRPYWEYYDGESRDLIANIFREDIEYFGYEFGDAPGGAA
jgi:hypothetical protein